MGVCVYVHLFILIYNPGIVNLTEIGNRNVRGVKTASDQIPIRNPTIELV